jgi:antirestriction protein
MTYDQEVYDAYKEIVGEDYYNEDEAEEAYQGAHDNDVEFVQQLLEDCGDIPDDLPHYVHINWEATARDVMMDYSSHDGHYFRNL